MCAGSIPAGGTNQISKFPSKANNWLRPPESRRVVRSLRLVNSTSVYLLKVCGYIARMEFVTYNPIDNPTEIKCEE